MSEYISYLQGQSDAKPNHPDSKVHGANMGPIWVFSAPDGPHVGPMNLATMAAMPNILIWGCSEISERRYNKSISKVTKVFRRRWHPAEVNECETSRLSRSLQE